MAEADQGNEALLTEKEKCIVDEVWLCCFSSAPDIVSSCRSRQYKYTKACESMHALISRIVCLPEPA